MATENLANAGSRLGYAELGALMLSSRRIGCSQRKALRIIGLLPTCLIIMARQHRSITSERSPSTLLSELILRNLVLLGLKSGSPSQEGERDKTQ